VISAVIVTVQAEIPAGVAVASASAGFEAE
jgi:hypothetical protein